MLLADLPPELLFPIFALLGQEFFRENVSRLTVSGWWYDYAWPVLVQDIKLPTAEALIAFTRHEHLLARTKPHITSLSLSLSPIGSRPRPITVAKRNEWLAEIQPFLARLAAGLRDSPRLRTLKLQVSVFDDGYPIAGQLADLVAARHLTSLSFDASQSGRLYEYRDNDQGADMHPCFCPSLNSLLPSLRKLHCRMDRVCPRLLAPPPGDSLLDLEEVVVSLSSIGTAPGGFAVFSLRCRPMESAPRTGKEEFRQLMQREARKLASRMHNPRMVRLILRETQEHGMLAWDALREELLSLRPGAAWNAEGRVLRLPM